jgi:hypothetical protein
MPGPEGSVGRVTRLIVYKNPGQGGISEEKGMAWESLANDLRDLGCEVTRADKYMEPGRVGIVYGDVVLIYLGMKLVDTVTDRVMEGTLQRIIDAAKAWGRERFGPGRDKPRARPTSITICDEDGKIIYAWTVDGTGEHEKTPSGDQEQDSRRPPLLDDVDDMPAIDEILAGPVAERGPDIWLLLRLTHEETHLRVDAFVGHEHRAYSDITVLPSRFVVTPAQGRSVLFQVDEATDEAGFEVTAPGWRSELRPIENSDTLLALCWEGVAE